MREPKLEPGYQQAQIMNLSVNRQAKIEAKATAEPDFEPHRGFDANAGTSGSRCPGFSTHN